MSIYNLYIEYTKKYIYLKIYIYKLYINELFISNHSSIPVLKSSLLYS